MTLLYAPIDGELRTCAEKDPKCRDFCIPFPSFFDSDTPLLHLMLHPDGTLLYTPTAGILLHADPALPCFFIEGPQRVALWLHTPSGAPLPLARGELLSLAAAGAPLRQGQLLGRLEPAALRRGEICLSLLTALPCGSRVQCRTGRLSGGRTPLLTADRVGGASAVEASRKNSC